MHPQPHWVEAFVSCVVDQVVEGSNHQLCYLFVALLQKVDGLKDMSLSNDDECFSGSNSKFSYFLIDVIMYFLMAEMVTLGLSSTVSGCSTQQLVFRCSFSG